MFVTGDTFLGVRFLSTESVRKIGAQRYLGCTFRSQGFSPSQRFSPFRTSWLYFTPHPPLGFRSSELFPLRQPGYLTISVALLSFRQRAVALGFPKTAVCPFLPSPAYPIFHARCAELRSCTLVSRRTSAISVTQLALDGWVWRAARAIQRVDARLSPGAHLTSKRKTAVTSSQPGRRLQSFDPAKSPFLDHECYPVTRPMLS
jgi:hypothetical protein